MDIHPYAIQTVLILAYFTKTTMGSCHYRRENPGIYKLNDNYPKLKNKK
jgi:hypothetical protein